MELGGGDTVKKETMNGGTEAGPSSKVDAAGGTYNGYAFF